MSINTQISRDLVKEAICSKVERNIELPVILQAMELQGFNERVMNTFGALFDYELAFIKHSMF